jgi:aminotransferase EvaB
VGAPAELVPVYSAESVDRQADPLRAISRVAARHRYVLGPEVERFETDFAAYCGVAECVAVANGTDAIEISLRCLGIGPGSRVALVANAGFYGSAAVLAVGAKPAYVDVDHATLTMSPGRLNEVLSAGVDAVIVTHLYGRLAAVEEIARACTAAGVPLVEDCAQAHGATRHGRRAGSFGTIACFSFYPTKNLPAVGDAGAVVTNDAALARTARSLRQYGWADKYQVAIADGRNSRMDEIQAAVLNDRLPFLQSWNRERQDIAARYLAALPAEFMGLAAPGADYVAHLAVGRVSDRDLFRRALHSRQIATEVHYPLPDHVQRAYASDPIASSDQLRITEEACSAVVTLPCFPGMTRNEVERVVSATLEFLASGSEGRARISN